MQVYVLILVQIVANGVGLTAQKKYQQAAYPGMRSHLLYLGMTGLAALLFFSAAAGFRLQVNAVTLGFSLLYAGVVAGSLVFRFLAMAHMNVLLLTLYSNAGVMLLPVLFGAVVYHEPIGPWMLAALALMAASILFPLWDRRGGCRGTLRGNLYGVVLFVLSGLSTILSKVYTRTPGVCDNNSFCFFTNLLLLAGVLTVLLCTLRRRPTHGDPQPGLREVFAPRQCVRILVNTAASNLTTLLTLIILQDMALSVYTMLSNALNMAGTVAVSRLVFREKITRSQLCSAVCALLAVLCSLL